MNDKTGDSPDALATLEVKFEPEEAFSQKQNLLLHYLKLGNTRRADCTAAGLHPATFYRWLKKKARFCDAVTRAEAIPEVGHVAVIANAAIKGDWRASLEWLKRRRRTEWGDTIDVSKLSDEQLLRLIQAAERSAETQDNNAPEVQ